MENQRSTKTIVMGAILTALILILQFLGSFIKLGPFSVSLVLLPIIIGVATCGKYSGAWMGFVFGLAVLFSGDAAAFTAVTPVGAIVTVFAKGILCGIAAEIVYNALKKVSRYVAVIVSAIVCPIVNTGVFLIGCKLFFMELISEWAKGFGLGNNVALYMIVGLVGANFLFELATNIVLSPVIIRLLNAKKAD